MKLLLLHQFRRKLQCRPHILSLNAVSLLNLLGTHPSRQPAYDACNGHARSANDWLAMLDLRVDDNAIMHAHIISPLPILCGNAYPCFGNTGNPCASMTADSSFGASS